MIHLSASTLWSAELCCHSLSKLALMMCLDLAKTTCLKSLGKGKFQNKAFIIKSCFKFLKQPFLKKTSITGYDYIFCRQFRSQLLDNRKRTKHYRSPALDLSQDWNWNRLVLLKWEHLNNIGYFPHHLLSEAQLSIYKHHPGQIFIIYGYLIYSIFIRYLIFSLDILNTFRIICWGQAFNENIILVKYLLLGHFRRVLRVFSV